MASELKWGILATGGIVHQFANGLKVSKTGKLVAVGSRGHGEIAGLLIDSVSNILVHKAACSVAIVRATD